MPVDTSLTGVTSEWGVRLTASNDSTGDGIPDIFVSGYSQDLPAAQVRGIADNNAGMVALISGATQRVVWTATPEPQPQPEPGVTEPSPRAPYGIGFYVSATGDVTGDGLEDVITGQPYRNIGANADQGRVYLLNGRTGAVVQTIESPDPQVDGLFGARLGTAGDVTGDRVPDMLVGANGHDFPAGCGNTTPLPAGCRKDEGQAYIFDGRTRALIRRLELPAEDRTGCTATGRCSFGGTVQSPGDINGDGWPDQTVAAYAWSPPGSGKSFVGRVYLFSGGPTAGQVLAKIDPPGTPNGGFFGLEDPDRYAPGDLNGDTRNDLYFNAFGAGSTGGHAGAGRAWTFNGAATVAAGTGVVLYELTDPDLNERRAFGWANSKTDYNRDGRPDLFVSNLATRNTDAYVFEGRTGSLLRRFSVPAADLSQETGTGPALGWSSRAPGDLNGDCEPDYVAGAPYLDVGGQRDQGKVYFFLSAGPSACPATRRPPAGGPPAGGPPAGPAAFADCPSLTANVIRGTAASNSITGTPRGDRIFAGTGNDIVDGLAGDDCIDLGTGADRGQGGLGADLMLGGLGEDRLAGSSGNDRIRGGGSNDRINGGFGNDVLHGQAGKDRVNGSRGRDRINGGSANDVIFASSSNDRVAGDQGSDRINGGSGNDVLKGNSGNDRIKGSTGRDRLSGGGGRDSINSRDGRRDRVSCGTGRDAVVADRIDRVARSCERVRRR